MSRDRRKWARRASVAALGTMAAVAAALDCPDLAAPTNLAAEMSTEAVRPVVRLTWAPPPGTNEFGELEGTQFSGYRVEFRDDTVGGSFLPVLTDCSGTNSSTPSRTTSSG